jgi:hypothetical protein
LSGKSYSDALAAFEAADYNTTFEILAAIMKAEGVDDKRLLPLLAESFVKVGMLADAAETFEQAADQESDETPIHLLKALTLHEHLGNEDKAFIAAMAIHKIAPGHPDVTYSLIKAFLRTGEEALIPHFQNELVQSNKAAHLLLAADLIGDDIYNENNVLLFQKLRILFPENEAYRFALLGFAREYGTLDILAEEEPKLASDLANGRTDILAYETPHNVLMWSGDESLNRLATNSRSMPDLPADLPQARCAMPHVWGDKLRIGYLSCDFWDDHATMRLFQSVLMAHDAEKVETTLFCYTPERFIAMDSGNRAKWGKIIQIGDMTDEQAADAIRAANIDILVDLKGHTGGARPGILNLKAAPIQVAWLGFPGSAVNIDCDYIIGDRFVTPDTSAPFYHEKFVRLPDTYQPNDPDFRAKPAMALRFLFQLPADKFVFASFNTPRKITTGIMDIWLEILKRADNSVLWLMLDSDNGRRAITAYAEGQGIDAGRILFASKTDYARHVTRLSAADLGLDTFPYNGHTTTSDKLWAGLPVLTAKGTNFASRVSESLLNAVGLPDLVASSPGDYIEKAVALAKDPEKIAAYKAHLKSVRMTAPLFDARRFARHLDKAYEMMAERAKAGLAPDHFDVPLIEG